MRDIDAKAGLRNACQAIISKTTFSITKIISRFHLVKVRLGFF